MSGDIRWLAPATSSDAAPPTVASASVNAAGTTLTVNFTEAGSPQFFLPASGATGFTLNASLAAVTLSSPSISSTTYTATITTSGPVEFAIVVRLSLDTTGEHPLNFALYNLNLSQPNQIA